jgi:hypothetical protein
MILAALLLAGAVGAPVVARWRTGDFFPPAAIAVAAWLGTLGLFALQLLPYVPVPAAVWGLVAGALVALVAGAVAGQWLGERGPAPPAPARPWPPGPVAVTGLSLLGLAGVAWYVRLVVAHDGWGLFGRGEELRYLLTTYAIPSRYLFLQQCCSAAALLAVGCRLAGIRLGAVATMTAVAAAAGTLTSTDRTQLFMLVLSALFMYLLRRGREVPIRRAIGLAVICPAVLAAAFVIIGAWTGKQPDRLGLRLQIPAGAPGSWSGRVSGAVQHGSVAYFYATGSYPALGQLVASGRPRTHGRHLAYPILRLLQRAGVADLALPPAIPAFVPVLQHADGTTLSTNAYTFLYYPLEDFGPAGAIAYAAAVGLLCGWAHGRVRRDRASPVALLVAGQLSTALALTFFVNKFNSTAFWYVLAWTLVPFAAGAVRDRVRGRRRAPGG